MMTNAQLKLVGGVIGALVVMGIFAHRVPAPAALERTEPVSTAGEEAPVGENFLIGKYIGAEVVKYGADSARVQIDWKQNGFRVGAVSWEQFSPDAMELTFVEPDFNNSAPIVNGVSYPASVNTQRLRIPVRYEYQDGALLMTSFTPTGCVITEEFRLLSPTTVERSHRGYSGTCTDEQVGAINRIIGRGPKVQTLVTIN